MPDAVRAECLSLAESLLPKIRELSPSIERDGKLPMELVDELRRAGFFHLVVPRDLGGREVDPVIAAEVVDVIARADGSTAWCLAIAAQNAMFAGRLAPELAQEIWGKGGICCGTSMPSGRAVPVDGGFRVSGRWGFASGSSHASWFVAETMIFDGPAPKMSPHGFPVTRAMFFPRDVVTVHNTWNTLGLRGTASNDFSVEDLFVPAERSVATFEDAPRREWALYRAWPLAFINHGTHTLGLARGAIESATAIALTKRGFMGVKLSDVARIQTALARATALVESASEYLYSSSQRLWEATISRTDDAMTRARVRLATSNATEASQAAVDLVHGVIGTAGIFTASPLERQFRDMHTASKHLMIGPLTYEAAGRVLLGMPPDFPCF